MTIDIIEPFADEKATIQIVSNSRVKETNSQEALTTELYMVGAELVKNKDFLEITSPATLRYEAKDTLSDLRIAICFSLASLGDTPITTNGPGCTSNIPSNNLKKLILSEARILFAELYI